MDSTWMEQALSWGDFSNYGVALAVSYALLRWLEHRLDRGTLYLEEADAPVRSLLRITLLVLDPLVLLTIVALFVAVWPLAHGILVGLLLLVGLRPLREYVSGRIMRFDQHARVGKHIIHGRVRGVINGFGLTGLYVQQEEGRTRVPYTALLDGGYTVAVDPTLPAYYHLLVTVPGELVDEDPEEAPKGTLRTSTAGSEGARAKRAARSGVVAGEDLERTTSRLRNRLAESPYVRPGFTISPHAGDTLGNVLDLDVGLHRGDHVRHLILQLREAGFDATLANR